LTAQQAAQVLRQGGLQFQGPGPRVDATELVSPQSPSESCQDMLANPQMDVLENGDGTGTVDSWTILSPIIYYSKVYSHSAPYSLKEMDELDGSDPVSITIGGVLWDYDEFGQLFRAPAGLTYLKASFSSMYRDRDANDAVYARLWTVNSQNQLDQFISAVRVPTDTAEYTWANWYWELNSAQLITASNKTLALVFTLFGNRASPGQGVYFDDAQVRLCYATGPTKNYLPVALKSPTGPTCTPYEPDNRDNRGNMTVGATCSGALGPSDDKDYYTLNLNGVTDVKLRLFNLPPEGNVWGAAIYEYPYTGQSPACLINWTGLDKSVNGPGLNLNKTYFVFVAASVPQSSPKSYSMSVTSLYGPTPTPTPTPTSQPGPTPGFWASTTGDEFYVSPDRANVLKFAIYINISQCGGTVKITHNTPAPISGNSFSFTGSFYASGTFDSSTSAHGTDGLSSFPINIPGVCSGTITAGPWNWTATWKNSTQPTVINMEPAGPITVELLDATSISHTVSAVK
jgi:hypothetical protein